VFALGQDEEPQTPGNEPGDGGVRVTTTQEVKLKSGIHRAPPTNLRDAGHQAAMKEASCMVTSEFLLQGYALALEQCGLLLRDAVRLYESRSYATAVVLAGRFFGADDKPGREDHLRCRTSPPSSAHLWACRSPQARSSASSRSSQFPCQSGAGCPH
jgi:hypothetical protein